MEVASDRQTGISPPSIVNTLWVVIAVAVISGALRFAIWAANWIVLWYLYGSARVKHDHLRMVRIKPNLVVSNGDVLHGFGFCHYLVSMAIWLILALSLLTLIFYKLIPKRLQMLLTEKKKHEIAAWALLIVVPLAILVTAVLPFGVAMTLAALFTLVPLAWMRRIQLPCDFHSDRIENP
jgi:hypothetical protein